MSNGTERHVCGLQGFNPMLGDSCPACAAWWKERPRSASETKGELRCTCPRSCIVTGRCDCGCKACAATPHPEAVVKESLTPHSDHPMRVWDRTCPACNPEAEALVDELREQLAAAEQRATAAERERDEAIRGLDNCIKDRHKMMQKRATLEAERPEMLGRLETAERENAALKHDIERHVGIAAAEATRAEAAESASAAMRHQMELIELETRDNGQWTLAEVNEVAADALRALAGKEAT